jgi:hypothetical protein
MLPRRIGHVGRFEMQRNHPQVLDGLDPNGPD